MRLRQIEDFLAVVDEGSIHAAARKNGLSQPAVTKSLRGLEAELHTQLVRRTNHGVVATPAGRAFYAHARAAQAELRKGEEEIAQLAGEDSGSVAFGVGPLAALLVVPEAVVRFRELYPAARVRVVEGFPLEFVSMVRDGTLDFAMRPKVAGKLDPALVFRPLFLDDVIVVGRKNHPLRNAGSLARLSTAVWVRSALIGGTSAGSLNPLFTAAPRTFLECDSYSIMVSVLAKSDALGLIVRRFLATAPACDLLEEIKLEEPMPTVTIGMVMRKDPPLTLTAAAMAKIVTAVTRQFTAKPAKDGYPSSRR